MKKVLKTIKKGVGIAVFVLIAVALVIAVATSMINRKKNQPTFFFGYALLWVETGSMEPTIPERSYILVEKYDGEGLAENTVVTFICRDASSAAYDSMVTHRIVGITEEGYKTQGDNSNPDLWTVRAQDIVAVYTKNLPVLTVCGRIFASPFGLVLIMAVFLGSCAFLYIPDIVRVMQEDRKALAEQEKEREIEKRVREEVQKMQERDREEEQK